MVPSCSQAGVIGSVAGIVGTIQANEAIKILLGVGETLKERLLVIDALAVNFRQIKTKKDPRCPLCGENPSIKELVDYEDAC
jgi:adenylyltransferase/sulfurtransferase